MSSKGKTKAQEVEDIKELTLKGAQLGFLEGFAVDYHHIRNDDNSPVSQKERDAFDRAFELAFKKGRAERTRLELESLDLER